MAPTPPYDPNHVYEVPLSDILADEEWNCRGFIEPINVLQLSRDIQANGLEYPVTLMPVEKGPKPFRLIAGYRRFKAHQLIEKKTIRATIKLHLTEQTAKLLNLRENLQREDLNIKQEANAMSRLRYFKPTDLARDLNKPVGWVNVRIALLSLPEDIQDKAAAGQITGSEIIKCSKLTSVEQQYEYVRQVREARLRNKKKEVKVSDIKHNERKLRTKQEIFAMQDILRRLFGNGIWTIALGWAGSANDDVEMHEAIRAEAEKIGKFYEIPEEYTRPVPDESIDSYVGV